MKTSSSRNIAIYKSDDPDFFARSSCECVQNIFHARICKLQRYRALVRLGKHIATYASGSYLRWENRKFHDSPQFSRSHPDNLVLYFECLQLECEEALLRLDAAIRNVDDPVSHLDNVSILRL